MEKINSENDTPKNLTKRAHSPELENILYEQLPALDHGFIRVVDYMGNDQSVVQAARVSYGAGTKKVNEDQGLINYLMRHRHSTPFEMCEIKLHVKLPIFIARQWVRHRTANINEYSARYSILSKEFYLPQAEHIAMQSSSNNQGRQENAVPLETAQKVIEILKQDAEQCYTHYENFLHFNEHGEIDEDSSGIARELARMNLTLNYYTEWYWKIDLHNLLNFVSLRADKHAQYEIRVYAEIIRDIVEKWVPYTYQAFCNYRMNSYNFSQIAVENINKMIQGQKITQENSNMTKREWREFAEIISIT